MKSLQKLKIDINLSHSIKIYTYLTTFKLDLSLKATFFFLDTMFKDDTIYPGSFHNSFRSSLPHPSFYLSWLCAIGSQDRHQGNIRIHTPLLKKIVMEFCQMRN